jgi:hypothetical protein
LLSFDATICGLTATAISVVGIGIELFAAAGGEIASPIPGVDGAAGFVALADTVDGNNQINEIIDPISRQQATEVVLGADTTFSLSSVLIGNTPLTPDAISDTAANLATVYYDITRLVGEEPVWGLRRLHYIQPETALGYFQLRVYDEESDDR